MNIKEDQEGDYKMTTINARWLPLSVIEIHFGSNRLMFLFPAADPEYYFKKMLKEQEKGLTARTTKLTVQLNTAGAKLRWLKNGSPMSVSWLKTNR